MDLKRKQISLNTVLCVVIFCLFRSGYVSCSIVKEIRPSSLYGSKYQGSEEWRTSKSKPSSSLPSSITTIKEENKEKGNEEGLDLENEVASLQFNSKLSKLYVKAPHSVNRKVFPKSTSNYLTYDKYVENFYKSSSMFTMENRVDDECVGHILEAEKARNTRLISFKCPLGTSVSYVRVEYNEYKYRPRKKNTKDNPRLQHIETAITGLGFGCDDNKSLINIGTLARAGVGLGIPEMKKMWIRRMIGYMRKSITGREFLSELVISGPDGTFGINYDHENKRGEAESKFKVVHLSNVDSEAQREWNGSFIVGGCVGLNIGKRDVFVSKIAMISVSVGPINGIPQKLDAKDEEEYRYLSRGLETNKVLAVPKLWPECQMLFGRTSGRGESSFFLFKLPNREEFFFNFIEVKYNLKKVPISIEFREVVSKSSLFLGRKEVNSNVSSSSQSSVITISRTGQISQITVGIAEENMSKIDLGFVSYLEVVIDGISTIFIQERIPSFRKTFSGENLKYVCAEISNNGNLLGFGAFFTNRLYVLPFSQGGVQTHYSDLDGILSSNLYGESQKTVDQKRVPQYYLRKHKKRAELPVVEFTTNETTDVYQGRSILSSVCDFGAKEDGKNDFDYYLVVCKPGYFLKSFNIFSYSTQDIIKGFEIGCGNGEVIIGEKTPLKQGIRITEHVQESESLGFEIGFSGSNLSEDFLPVSLRIFRKDAEVFNHRTVDIRNKRVIVPNEKVSWSYEKHGSFKGICFALDTTSNKIEFRGVSVVKGEKIERSITKSISGSVIRPNIFYPPDYRAYGLGYIAFGDVVFASRQGVDAPDECMNRWIVERNIKKGEKIKDMGNFAFSCPKGHIITHIYASSNKKTKLMGIVGLLCSDGYSGAIIGTSKDLIEFKYISLVETLLSLSPPYFITSVISGIPKHSNDKFLSRLETYTSYTENGEDGIFYRYVSENKKFQKKKFFKGGEIRNGPFDTFCALIQTKFIRGSDRLGKEGILNMGLGSSPKRSELKGGNPIKAYGHIYVNQITFPQCQMIRSPLSTEIRETITVSCPSGSAFTKIIPIKNKVGDEPRIAAFLVICGSEGVALIGYTTHEIDLDSFDNVSEEIKVYKHDLPIEHLTEIDVSFDFKKIGIQGLDFHINDGRISTYPEGVNKEEIKTLYTRKYIGNSLTMMCLEFGEKSKEVTGFGAYFKSQGLYWESDYLLPPTQFPFDKEKSISHSEAPSFESSEFVINKGAHLVADADLVCNNWAGLHNKIQKERDEYSKFCFSCGLSTVSELVMYFSDDLMEVVGVQGRCDTIETERLFKVGECDKRYKQVIELNSSGVGEIDFGFSEKSGIFGFFSFSTSSGKVVSKFRSKLMEFEGTGSSLYWSSEINEDKMPSTICFVINSKSGKIRGMGVPLESNEKVWEKIEPVMEVETVIVGTEMGDKIKRHYASEPAESRTVRGIPRVNSKIDLEGVRTLTLNELYGGFISHDRNIFASYCRKLVGVHKDDSKPIAIFCPKNHRIATLTLYLNSPPPNGILVGMKVACHGQFESQRVSVEDSWTGMFQVGNITEYEYKQGTEPTMLRSLVFGLNYENSIVYVFASDQFGRKYLEYTNPNETASKVTEYRQEKFNHLRGLCFEIDYDRIHRIGFIIE